MADVELRVDAKDDGAARLIAGLRRALRDFVGENDKNTRKRIAQLRLEATEAATAHRQRLAEMRAAVAAGREQVRQARETARVEVEAARDAAAATRLRARTNAEAARNAVQTARQQAIALRDGARAEALAAKDRVRASTDAARELLAETRAAAAQSRVSAREGLAAQQEQTRRLRENARAQLQTVREQAAQRRAAAQYEMDFIRLQNAEEQKAARQAVQAAVQRARATREYFRTELAQQSEVLRARQQGVRVEQAAGREVAQQQTARQEAARASLRQAQEEARVTQQRLTSLRIYKDEVKLHNLDIGEAEKKRIDEQIIALRRQAVAQGDVIALRQQEVENARIAAAATRQQSEDRVNAARAQVQAARDQMATLRQVGAAAQATANAETQAARDNAAAVKQTGRERLAQARANLKATDAQAKADIEVARRHVENVRRRTEVQNAGARENVRVITEIGQANVRAAQQTLAAEIAAGRITQQQAAQRLQTVQQTANQQIAAAQQTANATVAAGQRQVAAARATLQTTIQTAQQQVAAAQQAAQQMRAQHAAAVALAAAKLLGARAALAYAVAQRGLARATQGATSALNAQRAVANGVSNALRGMAQRIGAALLFRQFIKEGLEFNQVLETATLGIASLITAQAEITDGTGRVVQGQEALNVALRVSEKHMRALRIAGLQTAATTEDLVKAMQQAVGPGLAAGGSLDQIRQFTIQMTQAAGAIGLPFHQLNEEVRSLLAGTINYNTRIAKTLGISNAMVKSWREQGVLFDRLNEKFAAFNVAGERSMQNFAVLGSNMREAFQVFAGEATRPLFDQIKESGLAALNAFFDFDTGQIDAAFQGLITAAQSVFSSIGSLFATALNNAVSGAQKLSRWLDTNRVAVQGSVEAAERFVRAFADVVVQAAGAVAWVVEWGVQSGVVESILNSVSFVMEKIAKHTTVIAGALAVMSGTKLVATLAAMNPILRILTLAVGVISLIEEKIGRAEREYEAQRREIANTREEITKTADETIRYAMEYEELQKQIRRGGMSEEALVAVRKRQTGLLNAIIKLNPTLGAGLRAEKSGTEAAAKAVDALAQSRLRHLVVMRDELLMQLEMMRVRLRNNEMLIRLTAAQEGAESESVQKLKQARLGVVENFNDTVAAAQAVIDTLHSLKQAAEDYDVKVVPTVVEKSGTGKANNDLRQAADAAIAEIKSALDRFTAARNDMLARDQISFRQYFNDLTRAQQEAIDAQIQVLTLLRDKTTDPGEKRKITAELRDLARERLTVAEENNRALLEKEQELAGQILDVRLEQMRQEGSIANARRIELEREFAKLKARLRAEGKDTSFVDRLIDLQVARERTEELQAIIQRAQTILSGRLEEIDNLREQGMLSSGEQMSRSAEAYAAAIAEIERALPPLREFARLSGNQEAILGVQALERELVRLRQTQREFADDWLRIGNAARRGMEEALAGVFQNLGRESQTLREALVAVLDGMVAEMQQVVGQELAQTITAGLVEEFAKVGQSAAGEFVSAFVRNAARLMRSAYDATLGPVVDAIGGAIGGALGPIFGQRAGQALPPIIGGTPAPISPLPMAVPPAALAAQQSAASQEQIAATQMQTAVAQFAAAVAQFVAFAAGQGAAGAAGTTATALTAQAAPAAATAAGAAVENVAAVAGPQATAALATAVQAITTAAGVLTSAATALTSSATTAATAHGTAAASLASAAAALTVAAGLLGAGGTTDMVSAAINSLSGATLRFAGGGMVPGASPHARADDKLVNVTAREFVQPVPSVDLYGPRFMEAVRTRRYPVALARMGVSESRLPAMAVQPNRGSRFADGGLVSSMRAAARTGAAGASGPQRTTVELLVRQELGALLEVLQSDEVQDIQVRNVENRKNELRSILGSG